MAQEDSDAFVAQQSRRMMSMAMYRKLRSVVDSLEREERAKASIVAGAAYALLVWIALVIVGFLLFPAHAAWFVPAGFLAWLALVVNLMHRHLGAIREKT